MPLIPSQDGRPLDEFVFDVGGDDDDDVSLSLVPSGRPYVLAPRA